LHNDIATVSAQRLWAPAYRFQYVNLSIFIEFFVVIVLCVMIVMYIYSLLQQLCLSSPVHVTFCSLILLVCPLSVTDSKHYCLRTPHNCFTAILEVNMLSSRFN